MLIGVVVAKLFLVELSDRSGMARVISFIGVGILLWVVGYFTPLPPKKTTTQKAESIAVVIVRLFTAVAERPSTKE